VPTGRAHWEALLRARAIENLCGLIAPAQWGVHPSGRETFGDSMIIDHWGKVLARMPGGTGCVVRIWIPRRASMHRTRFPALEAPGDLQHLR
jgi:nitrilase